MNNLPEGTETYTQEKGPDHIDNSDPEAHARRNNWNERMRRFVPNSMIIRRQDLKIDTMALRRKLHYKYLLIFFLIMSVILSSVAIAGCSSSDTGLINAYLLEYRYAGYEAEPLKGQGVINDGAYATFNSNANVTNLAIRIGYFSTCINERTVTGNKSAPVWYCSKNVTKVVGQLGGQQIRDPFNAIHLMNELRSNVLSPAVLVISVCLTFMSMIVLSAADIKRAGLFFGATVMTLIACLFALVSLVWQQVSVDTAKSVIANFSNNAIRPTRGSVPAGLGWTSVVFLFGVSIGIVVLVLNEKQSLEVLQDFGSEILENEQRLGQNAFDGRSNLDLSGPYHPPGTTPSPVPVVQTPAASAPAQPAKTPLRQNTTTSQTGYPTTTPAVTMPNPY
ncbi:hypothetical protein D0Z00_002697 [Geotrichum galactomycetum]|uniref:Uncharacterized protein n=1 Tax=Geotrichum galactomycetum TaxID=27317 RepID=A0ACB6V3G6_9ASCO|nr:hypothetical protein D0Z00_002697 [Geotrichum candidum]